MSSSKADPRSEEKVVPFHLPSKNVQEDEYNSMLATFVGEYKMIFLFCSSNLFIFHLNSYGWYYD